MHTLILQSFIDRARSADRPLQSSIYTELGELLVKACEIAPEERLSRTAREKAAKLLDAAISSTHPGLTSFKQFSGLFRAICARNLIGAHQFEKSAFNFLNATVACFPAHEQSSFIENVNDCINEPEGKRRRTLLAALLDRTCYDSDLGDLSYQAQLAAASFLKPAICIELQEAPSSKSDERSLRLTEPRPRSDLPRGLIETRSELAQLANTVRWSGLSYNDSLKANCFLLVELLGLIFDGVQNFDCSRIDSLDRRRNIFAEVVDPPAPFYDGDF
ncbi:hypothetical protein ACVWXM_006238 [Bradyrhizobium sp. GM7.3]